MLTPSQKAKLEELWGRGLMKFDPHCPRLSVLVDEAVGVGLNMNQIKNYVKKARLETGMCSWEQEDVDREVLIALTLDELRVRRGISLQDEVDILTWTSSQRTGLEPRAASPSPPQGPLSGAPPLSLRPGGQVLAVGENDCGQLALVDEHEIVKSEDDLDYEGRLLPTPVALPAGKIIVDVAAGALHSAFLTSEGEVWTCGNNDEGEVARPTAGDVDGHRVTSTCLDASGLVAAAVSCGDSFTAILDTRGRLFWAGQLRDSNGVYYNIGPRLQEVPGWWAPVTKISTGGNHLAVLVANTIACCGAPDLGQLGRIRARRALKRSSKETALTLSPWTTASDFVDVCCGQNTTIGITAAGDIFGCGANNQCQLALEGPQIIWTTTRIEALSQRQLVQVAMGDTHGIALSSTGAVLCWGDRWEGQLGDNRACGTPSATPLAVHGLPNDIRQVSAGPRQSYCWTSLSQAYAWGSGVSNQLCVGKEVDRKEAPVPMVGLPARPILKISGGGQHVLVLVEPPAPKC
ncbi:regulator of chromosome condensation-like [Branchiostoma floridae]|uniref:Regulator of chromosome condensation-like n=1 Tax=Branchiostoma floridae TaxID=7739 RepID=A0A9J7LFG7_BRAFL|nr:regulator of chromosome condensation-like [Branchiostoma floridae]